MAHKSFDKVQVTTSTTGTGNLTLLGNILFLSHFCGKFLSRLIRSTLDLDSMIFQIISELSRIKSAKNDIS